MFAENYFYFDYFNYLIHVVFRLNHKMLITISSAHGPQLS